MARSTVETKTERVRRVVHEDVTHEVITLELDRNEAEAISYYLDRATDDDLSTRRRKIESGAIPVNSLYGATVSVLDALKPSLIESRRRDKERRNRR